MIEELASEELRSRYLMEHINMLSLLRLRL